MHNAAFQVGCGPSTQKRRRAADQGAQKEHGLYRKTRRGSEDAGRKLARGRQIAANPLPPEAGAKNERNHKEPIPEFEA